jgi:hypothetical protein
MLAQTVVDTGSKAALPQQRETAWEELADVYTIAAATRKIYRYIDMVVVVVGKLMVKMFLR